MRVLLFAVLLGVSLVSAQAPQPDTPPLTKPTVAIRGRVLTASGRPARRASVRLMPPTGGVPFQVSADLEGRYEFTEVPPGDYRLSAGKPGYLALEYGQRRPFEHGIVLTIKRGETLDKIDITLPVSGAISGRVVDANGDAVESIGVQLTQLVFAANGRRLLPVQGVARRVTNDLGEYRLFGVPPGEYIVVASVDEGPGERPSALLPPGYATTYFPGTPNTVGATVVRVGMSEQIEGIDIPLARVATARISGTVADSAGQPLRTRLLLSRSMRSGAVAVEPWTVSSDTDGQFEIRNVPSGDWVLQASTGADVNQGQEGEFVSRFVTINGTDVPDVHLQTSLGSRLEGRIIFEGNSAEDPTRVTVTTLPSDFDRAPLVGPTGRATGQPDATFRLTGLNGPRRLRLLRAPEGWSLKAIRVNGLDVTDEPLSFGTIRESFTDVEVVLTNRAAGVIGRVTNAHGDAATDYTVIVFATDGDRWYQGSRFLRFTRAKTDGTFAIANLPPSEYYVAAVDRVQANEGFGEWQDPAFLESIVAQANRITVNDEQSVAVTPRLIER